MAASYQKQKTLQAVAKVDTSTLSGKSVIVTGGASGLGEEFTRRFIASGAFVTIGDLSAERGEALVKELGSDHLCFVKCDVLKWSDQLNLFKTAISKSPSKTIDVVCANAGISGQDQVFQDNELTPDGDPKEPDLSILNINMVGVMYTAKLALHYFPQQPEGEGRDRCLILTASLAGYIDMPGTPQYCASKWGVRGLMRSLRVTMPREGMRVNIIAPWFVETRIISENLRQHIRSKGVKFANQEDVGRAAIHLASDRELNGR
jgi:NAD(P)-dependent dehydrogenase (short-subunit alcohol dehydrogenase family)